MASQLRQDFEKIKKLAKRAWWLGLLLGLVCHFVPPEYQKACHAIVNACSP